MTVVCLLSMVGEEGEEMMVNLKERQPCEPLCSLIAYQCVSLNVAAVSDVVYRLVVCYCLALSHGLDQMSMSIITTESDFLICAVYWCAACTQSPPLVRDALILQ